MNIKEALKQNGYYMVSPPSVKLAESILIDGENVLLAIQAPLYQDLSAKHFNVRSIPSEQRYNAIFVITDRRLFFCLSTPAQKIQMRQWLFDVENVQINKSFLSTPVLSMVFGYEELQILIPASKINNVYSCLQDAIKNCPVTAEDVMPPETKKPASKTKRVKSKNIQDDDFIPPEVDFHTKVVGVTFKNSDGSDRQKIISKCKVGQDVVFKPTPSKEYPEAVGVFTTKGKQLGFLKADLAHDLIHNYPTNPMEATISNITGGKGKTYGCNLHVHIHTKK